MLSEEARAELNALAKSVPAAVTILESQHRDLGLVVATTLARAWVPDPAARDVDVVVAIPDGRWSIDQLRESVFEELHTIPLSRRVVVIDRVDEIDDIAADTLLKVIEEPRDVTVFLLLSASATALKATIRGRVSTTVTLAPASPTAREKLLADAGYSADLAREAVRVAGEQIVLASVLAEQPQLLEVAVGLRDALSLAKSKPVTAAATAAEGIEKLAEVYGKRLGGGERGVRAAKRDLAEQHISLVRDTAVAAVAAGADPEKIADVLHASDDCKERLVTHAPLAVNLAALHIHLAAALRR